MRSFSILVIIFMLSAWSLFASAPQLSLRSRFSVLTCSPGPDLYSLFGHSAIRLQDSIGGRWFDVVYNYGTFRFDEYFYVKFARGKLDYVLETSRFDDFMVGYEYEGRAVLEQELLLTQHEKQTLFDLLQENVREENCTYRYDFFYDNCSTRIRDMIIRAVSAQDARSMGYRYVHLDDLLQINRVDFPYEFRAGLTYRQAIQTYLDYQPWSDLGIDLALGAPCDDVSGPYGLMFLPDSLMQELQHATIDGQLLCAKPQQILKPMTDSLAGGTAASPLFLFGILLLLQLVLAWKGQSVGPNWLDRAIVLLAGLIGVLVVFLWFFTDHKATIWNWNILWANPIHLVFLILAKRFRKFAKYYAAALVGVLILSVGLYPFLPQTFHPAVFVLIGMLIIAFVRYYRRSNFTQYKVSTL